MARRRRTIARNLEPGTADDPPSEPLDPLSRMIADAVARRIDGAPMTPWELPIVVACRNAIADAIRQLPIIAVRNRRPRPDQPSVYSRPDPDEPRGRTLERIAYQLTGPGYCWLTVAGPWPAGGFPLAVRLLDADQAQATETDVYQRVTAVTDVAGIHYTPGADIFRVSNAVTHAGDLGTSPLNQCATAVEFLCALYSMAGSFWEAGFPSVAMMVDHRLTKKQADDLKSQLLATWSRRHEPAVIDNGATLESVGSSAVESQLVESMTMANAEIARAYGVPASVVSIESGGSLTYATTEGEKRAWVAGGLGGYLSRIEEAFSALGPWGTEARLETDEWARGDNEARARFYASALGGAPWMLPDEVRDLEHLDPMPAAALPPADPADTAAGAGATPAAVPAPGVPA